jgi:hypothetical protein
MTRELIITIRKLDQDEFIKRFENYLLRNDINTNSITFTSTKKSLKILLEFDEIYKIKINDLERILDPMIDKDDLEDYINELTKNSYKLSKSFD